MKTPPVPENETQRQEALDETGLLSSGADPRFDRITRLASDLFSVPIALVSLIDRDRQWFKSRQGLEATETPRDISFCGHAIHDSEPLVIEDALEDERFDDNPLVCGEPDIRFYAGSPLHTANGFRLGTLCLIDRKPRSFSEADTAKLKDLAGMVEDLIQADTSRRNEYLSLETSLSNVQRRMELVVQGMDLGTWQYNVQTGETIFNERWAGMLGYTLEELEPTSIETFGALTHPEDSALVDAALKEHFSHKSDHYSITFRMRHKQGYWKWILSQGQVLEWSPEGNPVLMYGAHMDVDKEVTAEESLKENEARLRGLFEFSPIGIALNDFETGQFIDLNDALVAPTGYTREEFVELSYWDVTPKEYEPEEQKALASLRETGHYGPFEKEYIRKDGSRYPVRLQGMLRQEQDGSQVIWSLIEDITERKRMEQIKNEFISTVSHELRTPLTSVSGALGLVLSGRMGEIPEKAEKLLATAHRNSQRLALLINDLLDIEKMAAGKLHFDMQAQPIDPILEQALEENKAYGAEHRVKIELTGHSDAHVWVDEQRLKQVLANLLSNAIKFSPEGGMVTIETQANEDHVTVGVIDQGSGIPEEFQHKIFQRFAQADSSDTRQKGGTGLGMAITRELVEQMQGSIDFESTEGKGTRFYFQLPLVKTAEQISTEKAPESNAASDTSHRILVVEDDADVASLLKIMLEGAGYQADICHGGLEALDALNARHYDLISLDLMLPDVSGLDIIRRVRKHADTADIPVVVVSAKMEQGRLELNGEVHNIEWLAKPIEHERLMSMVKRQLLDHEHPKILHIEDDADLHSVVNAMVTEHMNLDNAPTLETARSLLTQHAYDAVLLDIGLPDGSGWDLIPAIKSEQPDAVIIVLTGEEVSNERLDSVEAVLMKTRLTTEKLIDVIQNRIHSHNQ